MQPALRPPHRNSSSSVPCRRFLASIRQGVMDSTSTAARASLPTDEVKTAAGVEGGGKGERGHVLCDQQHGSC